MRYTDEQLSRILGEHEAGTLVARGAADWVDDVPRGKGMYQREYPRCCVNQAAYNEPSNGLALERNPLAGRWFDAAYDEDMTPEELLTELETVGG